jgi:hypothetical protein
MDVINFNITNPFIDLISVVLSNWKDDYEKKVQQPLKQRHKIFQPYKIINQTGQDIEFCTFQKKSNEEKKNANRNNNSNDSSSLKATQWTKIKDNGEIEFNFYHQKSRNMFSNDGSEIADTANSKKSTTMHSNNNYAHHTQSYQIRELILHRIRLKLDDFGEIRPLTVDKVGTYFREMHQLKYQAASSLNSVTKISKLMRLVFNISLSGNATKLIQIKSPVLIKNRLNFKVRCQIEPFYPTSSGSEQLPSLIIDINKGCEVCVPIKYLPCSFRFKPLELGANREAEFNSSPLSYSKVNKPGQTEYFQVACKLFIVNNNFIKTVTNSSNVGSEMFHFFARIKRLSYPNKVMSSSSTRDREGIIGASNTSKLNDSFIDGHTINLEPAFSLNNLLPIEFRYKFISTTYRSQLKPTTTVTPKNFNKIELNGKIDTYKSQNFQSIDVSSPIEFMLDIDNFRMAKTVDINPSKYLKNIPKNSNDGENKSEDNNSDSSINNNIDELKLRSTNRSSSSSSKTKTNNENSTTTLLPNRRLSVSRHVTFFDENNRPLILLARIVFKIGSGMLNQIKKEDPNSTNKIDSYLFSSLTESFNSSDSDKLFASSSSSSSSKYDSLLFNAYPIVVHVSAFYCFFNLTGLPLIFKQYTCDDAAGQFEEHEMARSNQPLLFSYNSMTSNDSHQQQHHQSHQQNDVSSAATLLACTMRIGKKCSDFNKYSPEDVQPKWCSPFILDYNNNNSSFRPLHVINNKVTYERRSSLGGEATSYLHPNWVYYIGIDVKPGKGLLKNTIFVYFSTRYYLVNRSSQHLLVSQFYIIEELRKQNAANSAWTNRETNDDKKVKGHLYSDTLTNTPPSTSTDNKESYASNGAILLQRDSMTQFHWLRTDRDQLLSIRISEDSLATNNLTPSATIATHNWSSGFSIDSVDSFYLNMRNLINNSSFLFLRVEVILDGGTFFIIFSDTADFPPPIRIENVSPVPIYFYQTNTSEEQFSTVVRQMQSLNYSWDENLLDKKLNIGVKGGTMETFDFTMLDDVKHLYYENFIYISFTNVNTDNDTSIQNGDVQIFDNSSNSLLINSYDFVLSVSENKKIFIDYKESGNRQQLWHMTVDGLIVHEGSSAPKELLPNSVLDLNNRYVLDIEDMAPQPNRMLPLTLRRPDPRRTNTQRWSFNKDGQLVCRVLNMCIQVSNVSSSDELRPHLQVVLGPSSRAVKGIKVNRQRLKPGSGHLRVNMSTDGPTRLLRISNIADQNYSSIKWMPITNNVSTLTKIDSNNSTKSAYSKNSNVEIYVNLTGGIGISCIQWHNQVKIKQRIKNSSFNCNKLYFYIGI